MSVKADQAQSADGRPGRDPGLADGIWSAVHRPVARDDRSTLRFRGVDIPVALRWALLALAVLQLFSVISALRRMRRPEPEPRAEARLDLFDALSGMVVLAGFGLGNMNAALCGLALTGLVLALKAIRSLRTRRRA